jgi:4-cresol dehydrogenase (hydroxylating) flavoprotein subunit
MEQDVLVQRLKEIVGANNVITDAVYLEAAETTNYYTDKKIRLSVKPSTTEQLQQCIILANECAITVYPISRGCNWGYGSRVPIADNSILVELSNMNRILDYNEQLGYVTLEPGVTFQQLFEFLREKKSELILSATGGSTGSSLVGNAIERGIGTGLYADRFASVCGIEAVLPNGEIVASGFGRYGTHTATNVYRWGSGPSIDGLFSQSNFGIVTKLTQWLLKLPEYFQLVAYRLKDNNRLPALMDKLQDLAASGLVRPTITMYNDFRVLSTVMQYPFNSCTPGKTHPNDLLEVIRNTTPFGPLASTWNGEISIRSVNKKHGHVQASIIEAELKPFVDELFVVEIGKEEMLQTLHNHYNGITGDREADALRSYLLRKYIGIPENTPIKQTYWRKRKPLPEIMNPDADKCGMIWFSPIVPFTGQYIGKAIDIINNIVYKYPFEPAISLQCMTERAINIIGSINWDREVEGEDELAAQCYSELNSALKENGFFPYRDTTMGMQMKAEAGVDDSYIRFLSKIKQAIDPNNILAPGRYNIL